MNGETTTKPTEFELDFLTRYLKSNLDLLPQQMVSLDTNRLSIVFFTISSLDLIGKLDKVVPDKRKLIDWVYSMQVKREDDEDKYGKLPGFVGGSFLGTKSDAKNGSKVGKSCPMNHGHLAMTYFALATLTILGDDFGRVDRVGIVEAIKQLQRPDGSFEATGFGTESGMRFLYCACAVSYMLNDWSGVDIDMAKDYIRKCTTYDGAMGLHPGQESHGGSTYCAVAALTLMGEQKTFLKSDDSYSKLVRWCIHRQVNGFQGRRNKDPDTCYSFWVGASLKMLHAFDFVDAKSCCAFHKTCEFQFGGFCKFPESRYPDPLHTYFSICALSMLKTKGFQELEPMLCISERASRSGVWNDDDDDEKKKK